MRIKLSSASRIILFQQICCLSAITTAKEPQTVQNDDGEDDVELVNEEIAMESEENSVNCDDGGSESCDNTSDDSDPDEAVDDEDEATVEEEIPEKPVKNEKLVTIDLKAGRTCRLKTEGEKLSKIIRKTGKAQQKAAEKEIVPPKVKPAKKGMKVQSIEKQGKAKRDTRAQEMGSKNRKQQKVSKKNVFDSGSNSKKKSSSNKKKNFKTTTKSSKKTQRNKKSSKNEL